MFISVFFKTLEVKATQMYIYRWIDKQNVVYIYSGILLTLKKEGSLDNPTTRKKLKDFMLSEVSWSQKTYAV